MYDALTVRTFLAGTAVNRERERAGEKLFRMSEVFREVESAFKDMDEGADEAGAKRRVAAELKERLCLKCEKRARCEKSVVYTGFARLVEAGTLKGKVNLIDLPPAVTQNCTKPADAIKELNLLLAEYRRYMTEAENARGGRQLLADQARGISAVLKSNAVDMCRELKTDAGENIARALAQCGIMCPEAAVSGDENPEITAIIGRQSRPSFGNKGNSQGHRREVYFEGQNSFGRRKKLLHILPTAEVRRRVRGGLGKKERRGGLGRHTLGDTHKRAQIFNGAFRRYGQRRARVQNIAHGDIAD